MVGGELRIGIFAAKGIAVDDEILVDYGEFYVQKLLTSQRHDSSRGHR